MNNPLDGTGAMYDDDKIFPRLLQALIDDANIDIVTINLEANDPAAQRAKERQPLFGGHRKSRGIESQTHRHAFSSVVGGPVDREILLPLRQPVCRSWKAPNAPRATIRNLAEYHEFKKTSKPEPVELPRPPLPAKLPSGILPAQAAFRLLEQFGIPSFRPCSRQSADEAVAAAERMGFPVALKIESAEITHKSDVGGVALNCLTPAKFARRTRECRVKSAGARLTPRLTVFRAARWQRDGVEMILGIKRDPLFGPVVLCGFGGILVELLKDVAIGIPPLTHDQARDTLKRLRGFAILEGVRGKPPADVDALCDAIVGVSRLAVEPWRSDSSAWTSIR